MSSKVKIYVQCIHAKKKSYDSSLVCSRNLSLTTLSYDSVFYQEKIRSYHSVNKKSFSHKKNDSEILMCYARLLKWHLYIPIFYRSEQIDFKSMNPLVCRMPEPRINFF